MEYSRPAFHQALTHYQETQTPTAIIMAFIPDSITHKHRIVGKEGERIIQEGWNVFVDHLPPSSRWTRWSWSRYLILVQIDKHSLVKMLEQCFAAEVLTPYWRVGFSVLAPEKHDMTDAFNTLEWKSVKIVQYYVLDRFFHVKLDESQ